MQNLVRRFYNVEESAWVDVGVVGTEHDSGGSKRRWHTRQP
ncbi:hypothetical protein [Palaeococcus sp. (in: euryarchaeotes)]